VQLFDQEFVDGFEFDVLDPTKIIPEEQLLPLPVGRLVLDRMPDNFFAETEQVAFMTQNVPPGIDFSNDPLLQGRNFSYLDTQLKRLGSPNFTHLPINAPKCPFAHFQQDGHMAMRNPAGRVNYQPNSWNDVPRESPERGFRSFADAEAGQKVRLRAESFADHYSQARQFFLSQKAPEQRHIAMALTFELSKVERPVIRERMVAHLRNIDEELAVTVASKLGIDPLPKAADAAMPTRDDLQPSPALSIIENGPDGFAGAR
jgi:catalase